MTATATKTKSTKQAKAKVATDATEKARKAAIATIEKRLADDATTAAPAKKAAKGAKKGRGAPRANVVAKGHKVSALDAAATVLSGAKEPMRAQQIVEAMAAKGLWSSPNGKTPHATLHAALMREIKTKASASRFKKAERGLFAANGKAA